MQPEKIFLGNTPSEQRKFITAVLRHNVESYPTLIIPACGQFTLVKCAIEAGYKPENIYASDISLFSSVLGYLFSGQDINQLEFELGEEYRERYDQCQDDFERAAYLLWIMKTKQLRTGVYHEYVFYDEIVSNSERYIANLASKLRQTAQQYEGLNYSIEDLRDVIRSTRDSQTIVIVNPPAFKKGYEKMFDFTGAIEWNPDIEEFDFDADYMDLYEESRQNAAPFLWYRYKDASQFPDEEVIFAREYDTDRYDYWLTTKPEIVEGMDYNGAIVYKKPDQYKPYKSKVFDGEITENTRISFVQVNAEVALYYRDLFAHKLGNTKAEQYFLMLLDGEVFGTTGFMTRPVLSLQSSRVFENFGFNTPVEGHPRANRLLMWAITSQEFAEVVKRTMSKVNRFYTLDGLRTTCLSKYRKVKLNNGILEVEKREKLPSGLYKIMYDTDFRQEGFDEVMKRYLSEEGRL